MYGDTEVIRRRVSALRDQGADVRALADELAAQHHAENDHADGKGHRHAFVLVLFFFLRGWRSTASVIIAIPTSLISTFFVMYMAGFSFNMMSLMGMTLCVGILVDDSIVVLENIHRHLAKGEDAKEAAVTGRMEIGMAAIAITLCDVVVFLPIAFMSSMTGQFFKQFGLTIVFASLFSLFISFTLTPMLASKFFKNGVHVPDTKLWRTMDRIENSIQDLYAEALHWSFFHKKKLFAGVALSLIIFTAMVPLGIIGREYMPRCFSAPKKHTRLRCGRLLHTSLSRDCKRSSGAMRYSVSR